MLDVLDVLCWDEEREKGGETGTGAADDHDHDHYRNRGNRIMHAHKHAITTIDIMIQWLKLSIPVYPI